MAIPKPIVPLDGICSVIHNNTLYTYSSTAFQSLPLEGGAEWSRLPHGVPVEGGVCVGTTPADESEAAFYVIGGTSSNPEYWGLQRFVYSAGEWETVRLSAPVTQSRRWHGASYLEVTNSILMYAGSQDGSRQASSQTFTINISDDHRVLAWESIAPPTISPILLPWSEARAALIEGSSDNGRVMLFSPVSGWEYSGSSLAFELSDGVRAVLAAGDDASKSLYTFDMTTSPNTVNRTVLVDGNGMPLANSAPVQRRQLTLDRWPKYNDTLAPKATRSQCAIAQDLSGLVVIAGGNQDDVLSVFDASENQWVDASALFVEGNVAVESLPSSTSGTTVIATDTSTSIPTSTEARPPEDNTNSDGGMSPTTLLGAVVGSVLGAVTIIAVVVFWLRRRRQRRAFVEAGHARRASGRSLMEKDGFAYAKDFKNPVGDRFNGHQPQDSQSSLSSMAILMGNINQNNKQGTVPVKRRGSFNNEPTNHDLATDSLNNTSSQETAEAIVRAESSPPSASNGSVQPQTREPGPSAALDPNNARRSSGWNKYWSGGSALNILGFTSKRTTLNSKQIAANPKRITVNSDTSSNEIDPHRVTRDSVTMPNLPLDRNDRFPPLDLQRVNSGSPTVTQHSSKTPLNEGMVGQIERPSSEAPSSHYSSGIPASVHDSWDPTSLQRPWGRSRALSNTYSQASMYPAPISVSNAGNATTNPRSFSVSRQPQLAVASMSSDMSWLTLGDQARGR